MSDASDPSPPLGGWLRRLATPRGMALSVAIGTFLAIPAVGPHLALDDFILGLVARGSPDITGLPQDSFDLFGFTTGQPDDNRALVDGGIMLPWWTDPELRVAFFRPLSSLTHRLDFRFAFPAIALMHAHSLAWLALALGSVAWLYRRLDTHPGVAGLAALLYALDDAHGWVVGWLSNRNALVATVLGVAVIAVYVESRQRKSWVLGIIGPALFGVSLLAGEFAAGAFAYVLAHALTLGTGSVPRRLVPALPYLGVGVAWRVAWGAAGYGVHGSGAYVDPLAEPLAFAKDVPVRILALLHGAFSTPPSDLFFLAPPSHRPLLVAVGITTLVLVGLLLAPLLKRDATARFWAVGAALSVLPVSASFSSDRLLLFTGIGAMALMARLFVYTLGERERLPRWRRILTGCFALVHLLAAPLMLPVRAAQMQLLGALTERIQTSLDVVDHPGVRATVVVNAPVALLASYLEPQRALLGRPRSRAFYWLSTASSAVTVERVGTHALRLQPDEGFLLTPLERHYRGSPAGLEPGTVLQFAEMTVTVESSMADGRPERVRFSFPDSLDTGSAALLRWSDDHYEPLVLDVGQSVRLPPQDFGEILARYAVGLATRP